MPSQKLIIISWEENYCYLHLLGSLPVKYRGSVWQGIGMLCPGSLSCKQHFKMVITSCIEEVDLFRLPYAFLKIYLNQDTTRAFWSLSMGLEISWEFTSFPSQRQGAVTYPARLASLLYQPPSGRFYQSFKRKGWHQPVGSVWWAADVNASSTDRGRWYILRYLRYFQIASGVGRDFSFGSLNSSENLETVAIFPGLYSVIFLKVKCVKSFLLESCLRRECLLWCHLHYSFPTQMKLLFDSQPHLS